jgi:hypothetical protein
MPMLMMSSKRNAANRNAVGRVEAWTRKRFALAADCTIFVAEVACALPGCPPIETFIAFWTAPDHRHAFKVFKPVGEIVEDDLPPSWMKDAIIADEIADCC